MSNSTNFVNDVKEQGRFAEDEKVLNSIWKEYERVVLESLITSFGLDFMVHDQLGGDVDTIHNVRNGVGYKNIDNAIDYFFEGEYNTTEYHSDDRYIEINRKFSEQKKAGKLKDSYTGKKVERNADIDLDHVIAAKEIHDDPGRILAGLSGTELANSKENLKPTDRSINRSMQADNIEDWLKEWEEKRPERVNKINELKAKDTLTDKERKQLRKLEKIEEVDPEKTRKIYKNARKSYERKINFQYYFKDPKFAIDTFNAAGKRGLEMGARQALGFVFAEIWFITKDELTNLEPGVETKEIFVAVGSGVKKGFESAGKKYDVLITKYCEGFYAGGIASLTTTICNIFFTTAENLVKIIRQMYASVVQASTVLLFNPDNLDLGDRLMRTTLILATGASVIAGTTVGEAIAKTPLGAVPELGGVVQTFCSTMVSGLISCSLLLCMDRSKFMNNLISKLNQIPSDANNYKEIANLMERLAAKMEKLDIDKFKEETEQYNELANLLYEAIDEDTINEILLKAYEELGISPSWRGDLDTFMSNKKNHLIIE